MHVSSAYLSSDQSVSFSRAPATPSVRSSSVGSRSGLPSPEKVATAGELALRSSIARAATIIALPRIRFVRSDRRAFPSARRRGLRRRRVPLAAILRVPRIRPERHRGILTAACFREITIVHEALAVCLADSAATRRVSSAVRHPDAVQSRLLRVDSSTPPEDPPRAAAVHGASGIARSRSPLPRILIPIHRARPLPATIWHCAHSVSFTARPESALAFSSPFVTVRQPSAAVPPLSIAFIISFVSTGNLGSFCCTRLVDGS
ncbi:uncharacterized protein LOC144713528 [Wolffia australiana]